MPRGRRGGGNAAPHGYDQVRGKNMRRKYEQNYEQARYMHELSQQMEEQKARKAAEEQAQVDSCEKGKKGLGLDRSHFWMKFHRKFAESGLVGGERTVCG